jgi:NADH-quinone oxidoreductase subunit N
MNSLAAYVLAAMLRTDERSAEAGLKYFVLGSLASGILLFGISLTYGFTGTTSFAGIHTALARGWTMARCSGWCSCWWVWRSRSAPCRSTCGPPTL